MNLLLLALSLAAPVPKEVVNPKPPQVVSGVITLMWGTSPYRATLNGNGEFSEFLGGHDRLWVGVWSWDSGTRTLTVAETPDGGCYWLRWTVVLDRELRGKTDGGTRVHLTPFRPPVPMPER